MQNGIFAERLSDSRRELTHVRASLSGAMPGHRTPHHSDKYRVPLLPRRRRRRRRHGNRPPAVHDSHRLPVAIHLLDHEHNQPRAHRRVADRDIVHRGDRGIDETRVPGSQPIVGAATSALLGQVASLAERDLPGRRLAFRELKQLGRGPAVQWSASRELAQQDEVVEAERSAAATRLVDEVSRKYLASPRLTSRLTRSPISSTIRTLDLGTHLLQI